MKKLFSKLAATALVCLLAVLVFTGASAATADISVKNSAGKVVATFPVDTAAAADGLQDALDYARDNATAKNILRVCLPSGTYTVGNTLNVYSNTTLDLSGAKLKRTCDAAMIRFGRATEETFGYNGYENITIQGAADSYATLDGGAVVHTILRFAHSRNINIRYITFTNVTRSHHLEFAGCDGVTVENCKFNGFNPVGKEDVYNHEAIQMDILTEGHFPNYLSYDGTVNKNITIRNSTFENVNRGVGVHSGVVGQYMDNILITGNTFKNVNGYAIVATNYVNSVISNNVMTDCGAGIFFRHITPGNVNYYAGSAKNVRTNMNCTISGNTISLKSTTFDNTRYGISVYGRVVSKAVKVNGGTIPAADYRVSGLTITGNTITTKTYANGIWLQGVLSTTVSDNSVTYTISKKTSDSCDGIKLEDTNGITLSGNTVTEKSRTRIARTGLYLRNAANTTIVKNTVKNMYQDGIYLDNSDGCVIEGNTVDGVRKHGIYVDAGSGTSKVYISVTGNTVKNVGSRGINVNDKSYANIVSNTITKTGEHGICIIKSAVAKNVKNNTVSNAGDVGIYVNNKSTATTVSGNTITSPKAQGIYFNSGASGSTVEKNTITKPKSYGIFVKASSVTKISSNTVTGASRGVNISESTVKYLQSNTISGSKSEGIYLTDKATVTNIKKNKVSSSGKHGIHISGASKCTNLESNTITLSTDHGIYLKSKAAVTSIKKNTIVDSGDCGIRVISSKPGKITANTIKANAKKTAAADGVFLSGASTASAISSNKITGTKGHGIYLSDTTTVSKIEKNTVKNAGDHGMYLKGKVSVTTLSSNTIQTVKTHGIYLKDTAAVKTLSKNTISGCGRIGLNVDKKAKTSASANKISKCAECEIRLIGSTNKKVTGSAFAISLKKTRSGIVLSWNGLKNIQKYEVYRSTSKNGTYKKIGTTDGTSFTDKNVKSGKTYYYKVIPTISYSLSTVRLAPSPVKRLKFR